MGKGAASRSAALWRAGRDRVVPWPARGLARVVSAYERAPVREILPIEPLALAEEAATAVMMRVALWLGGARADGVAASPPASGGRGTLLAVTAWLLPFVVIALVARAVSAR